MTCVRDSGGSDMSGPVPVIDLQLALRDDAPQYVLDDARRGACEIGMIQVINHGLPGELIEGFDRRVGRLFALPAERKAALASPSGHPYRGWRQCPDERGR